MGAPPVERHGEHVMQHEGMPFRGIQCLQHDEQGRAHRVGQQCLVLRVDPVFAARDGLGQVLAY